MLLRIFPHHPAATAGILSFSIKNSRIRFWDCKSKQLVETKNIFIAIKLFLKYQTVKSRNLIGLRLLINVFNNYYFNLLIFSTLISLPSLSVRLSRYIPSAN